MQKIPVAIIEDNPEHLDVIKEHVLSNHQLDLVSTCSTLTKAQEEYLKHLPKIIFLDIEINKKNSLKWAKMLKPKPQIIITSAYPEFAIEAFDTEVAHFLVKPIEYTSFLKALDVAVKKIQNSYINNDLLYLKVGHNEYHRLNYTDIKYMKADGDYVKVAYNDQKSFLVYLGLRDLKKQLPGELFVQISRSIMINVSRITKIVDDELFIEDEKFAIGNTYKNAFFENNIFQKLIKRSPKKD
jgi:DNA-binding LytR/AlgR family response regulator